MSENRTLSDEEKTVVTNQIAHKNNLLRYYLYKVDEMQLIVDRGLYETYIQQMESNKKELSSRKKTVDELREDISILTKQLTEGVEPKGEKQ